MNNIPLYLSGVSVIGILFSYWAWNKIKKSPGGDWKMEEVSRAIEEGSRAFIKRQYKVVALVAIIIAALLYFFIDFVSSVGFLVGGAASALAGYLGMMTAVKSNVKVAEAAKKGLAPAFSLAYLGGSVTGFLVVSLGLLVISIFWLIAEDLPALLSLGFGGSLISVFARLGGGIYTKGADVGADLVGKIELGIPEDDPRNPAVIADNVGDNVGDDAGMAADLFETYAVTLVAALLLAHTTAESLFPFALGAGALLASIIGFFFGKIKNEYDIMKGLYRSLIWTSIIAAGVFIPLSRALFDDEAILFYLSAVVGLCIALLMVVITDYYTSKKYRPVRSIAQASESGHGTNIIMGISVGLESTFAPIILIVAGILTSFWIAGLYGVAITAFSLVSLAGIVVTIDAFGPITDNAGGIAEMAGLPKNVRDNTDPLDAVGNTTKAVTKGYAIASAGLGALALFAAYTESAHLENLSISEPLVLAGLFIGGALPYLFGSIAMRAVVKTAGSVVEEVRRQWKEIKGLAEGTAKPDYARTVDIVTRAALREMVVPALIPIVIVLAVGFILGKAALGGLLMGVIITGLFVAISMTSGGAAWDNAKKYIEDGHHGGKKSPAHQAAVTGDTVGDPYKDTAGPAINPMIKVVNIVALLIVG